MSRNQKMSTTEQRLRWLKDRPELWKDAELVAIAGGTHRLFLKPDDHKRIAGAMRNAGLFSRTTNYSDIRVERLIRALRQKKAA